MSRLLELARQCSFLLAALIGLCALSIYAFHLLDRILTGIAKWIGLWPFLTEPIWKYARSRDAKDRPGRGREAK